MFAGLPASSKSADEGVHVERKIVEFSVVVRHRRVRVAVEGCELVYEVPDSPVGRVEDVRTVGVGYAVHYAAADVPAGLMAFLYDEALFAAAFGKIGECRPVKPEADDEEVVYTIPQPIVCLMFRCENLSICSTVSLYHNSHSRVKLRNFRERCSAVACPSVNSANGRMPLFAQT